MSILKRVTCIESLPVAAWNAYLHPSALARSCAGTFVQCTIILQALSNLVRLVPLEDVEPIRWLLLGSLLSLSSKVSARREMRFWLQGISLARGKMIWLKSAVLEFQKPQSLSTELRATAAHGSVILDSAHCDPGIFKLFM